LNYCIPDFTDGTSWTPEVKANWRRAWEEFTNSTAGSSIKDLYLASTAIWISIGLAPVYCMLFIGIMSAFAEVIAWICVVLVQIGLIGASVGCYLWKS